MPHIACLWPKTRQKCMTGPKLMFFNAPSAEAEAAPTCSETEDTNLAKGFVDNAILNEFSYYSVFILDKMCYYIN